MLLIFCVAFLVLPCQFLEIMDEKMLDSLKFVDKIRDKQHLMRHLRRLRDTASLKDVEIEFEKFKLLDTNNDNYIDGSEIFKEILNKHHDDEHDHEDTNAQKLTQKNAEDLTDLILKKCAQSDSLVDYSDYKAEKCGLHLIKLH